jgi:ABC-type xylose transport system permease subunit
MKQIVNRMKQPTPVFFKKLRNIGLALAAAGATLLAAPIGLPLFIVNIGGYLALAGSVMTAVSQSAVTTENQ